MSTIDEYKNSPESTIVRLNWIAGEYLMAKAKLESTKAFQAYKIAESALESQKKDTIARLKSDGVNFTVKATNVTCSFVNSKGLNKEALGAFLEAHGASLTDFEVDASYFRVTAK